jgi:hypothetical protein
MQSTRRHPRPARSRLRSKNKMWRAAVPGSSVMSTELSRHCGITILPPLGRRYPSSAGSGDQLIQPFSRVTISLAEFLARWHREYPCNAPNKSIWCSGMQKEMRRQCLRDAARFRATTNWSRLCKERNDPVRDNINPEAVIACHNRKW